MLFKIIMEVKKEKFLTCKFRRKVKNSFTFDKLKYIENTKVARLNESLKAVGYMLNIKINYIYTHEQINEPKLKEIPFLLTPDS